MYMQYHNNTQQYIQLQYDIKTTNLSYI